VGVDSLARSLWMGSGSWQENDESNRAIDASLDTVVVC